MTAVIGRLSRTDLMAAPLHALGMAANGCQIDAIVTSLCGTYRPDKLTKAADKLTKAADKLAAFDERLDSRRRAFPHIHNLNEAIEVDQEIRGLVATRPGLVQEHARLVQEHARLVAECRKTARELIHRLIENKRLVRDTENPALVRAAILVAV